MFLLEKGQLKERMSAKGKASKKSPAKAVAAIEKVCGVDGCAVAKKHRYEMLDHICWDHLKTVINGSQFTGSEFGYCPTSRPTEEELKKARDGVVRTRFDETEKDVILAMKVVNAMYRGEEAVMTSWDLGWKVKEGREPVRGEEERQRAMEELSRVKGKMSVWKKEANKESKQRKEERQKKKEERETLKEKEDVSQTVGNMLEWQAGDRGSDAESDVVVMSEKVSIKSEKRMEDLKMLREVIGSGKDCEDEMRKMTVEEGMRIAAAAASEAIMAAANARDTSRAGYKKKTHKESESSGKDTLPAKHSSIRDSRDSSRSSRKSKNSEMDVISLRDSSKDSRRSKSSKFEVVSSSRSSSRSSNGSNFGERNSEMDVIEVRESPSKIAKFKALSKSSESVSSRKKLYSEVVSGNSSEDEGSKTKVAAAKKSSSTDKAGSRKPNEAKPKNSSSATNTTTKQNNITPPPQQRDNPTKTKEDIEREEEEAIMAAAKKQIEDLKKQRAKDEADRLERERQADEDRRTQELIAKAKEDKAKRDKAEEQRKDQEKRDRQAQIDRETEEKERKAAEDQARLDKEKADQEERDRQAKADKAAAELEEAKKVTEDRDRQLEELAKKDADKAAVDKAIQDKTRPEKEKTDQVERGEQTGTGQIETEKGAAHNPAKGDKKKGDQRRQDLLKEKTDIDKKLEQKKTSKKDQTEDHLPKEDKDKEPITAQEPTTSHTNKKTNIQHHYTTPDSIINDEIRAELGETEFEVIGEPVRRMSKVVQEALIKQGKVVRQITDEKGEILILVGRMVSKKSKSTASQSSEACTAAKIVEATEAERAADEKSKKGIVTKVVGLDELDKNIKIPKKSAAVRLSKKRREQREKDKAVREEAIRLSILDDRRGPTATTKGRFAAGWVRRDRGQGWMRTTKGCGANGKLRKDRKEWEPVSVGEEEIKRKALESASAAGVGDLLGQIFTEQEESGTKDIVRTEDKGIREPIVRDCSWREKGTVIKEAEVSGDAGLFLRSPIRRDEKDEEGDSVRLRFAGGATITDLEHITHVAGRMSGHGISDSPVTIRTIERMDISPLKDGQTIFDDLIISASSSATSCLKPCAYSPSSKRNSESRKRDREGGEPILKLDSSIQKKLKGTESEIAVQHIESLLAASSRTSTEDLSKIIKTAQGLGKGTDPNEGIVSEGPQIGILDRSFSVSTPRSFHYYLSEDGGSIPGSPQSARKSGSATVIVSPGRASDLGKPCDLGKPLVPTQGKGKLGVGDLAKGKGKASQKEEATGVVDVTGELIYRSFLEVHEIQHLANLIRNHPRKWTTVDLVNTYRSDPHFLGTSLATLSSHVEAVLTGMKAAWQDSESRLSKLEVALERGKIVHPPCNRTHFSAVTKRKIKKMIVNPRPERLIAKFPVYQQHLQQVQASALTSGLDQDEDGEDSDS